MILATTTFEDYERFLDVFSPKGAEKRREHGSKGAMVFRDPNQSDRVWVVVDWDEAGRTAFVTDPTVPGGGMKDAGHTSKPHTMELAATVDA